MVNRLGDYLMGLAVMGLEGAMGTPGKRDVDDPLVA